MSLQVPLSAIPSQSVSIVLALQNCVINVYQKSTGLYFDLTVNNAVVTVGRICRDADLLLDESYQGVIGNFCFIDTQGNEDPIYTGLGARWILVYLEAADLL